MNPAAWTNSEIFLAFSLFYTDFLFPDRFYIGRPVRSHAGAYLRFPRYGFSPHRHRRRQRGHACGADAGHHHQADRRCSQFRAWPEATVRSTTSRGSADISLFFDWNVDMFHTLQLVDAALSKVQQALPATAHITTTRLTFATFPILGYALTADDRGPATVSQTRLWEIAAYDLKPPLNRVEGVSTVIVQGGKVPEFHIIPDPARLQASGVTLLDLLNGVQSANIIDSPGLYEADHELILGLIGAQAHSVDELANLVIKTTATGAPIHVADIATVEPSTMPVYTAVTSNGKPAVLLNIARQVSSNTVQVADAVAAQVAALQSKLPPGVHLQLFYDQSQLVRESIASVRDAILIGLVLACLILFLFLHDWRSSLVAGLVIPVTVAITHPLPVAHRPVFQPS